MVSRISSEQRIAMPPSWSRASLDRAPGWTSVRLHRVFDPFRHANDLRISDHGEVRWAPYDSRHVSHEIPGWARSGAMQPAYLAGGRARVGGAGGAPAISITPLDPIPQMALSVAVTSFISCPRSRQTRPPKTQRLLREAPPRP